MPRSVVERSCAEQAGSPPSPLFPPSLPVVPAPAGPALAAVARVARRVKQSGLGREGGPEGLHEYQQLKYLSMPGFNT